MIKSILKDLRHCKVEVITSKKILLLKETFKNKIKYHFKHNLIETIKNKNGSINRVKTKKMFFNWFKIKKKWIHEMKKRYPNSDLIISDSVPQAFELAKQTNTKSINISHFTWNWFYEKHFSKKKNDQILNELNKSYSYADKHFILPITPKEITKKYKNRIFKINFIISDFRKKTSSSNKFKNCIIMDNGTSLLSKMIEKTIPYLKNIEDINFYVNIKSHSKKVKKIISSSKNIIPVYGLKKIHHTIPIADFVIARGGFNTITETLILKKPAIFFNEINNEETSFNIKMLQEMGVISVINNSEWGYNIVNKINKFIKIEMPKIKKKIINRNFKSTGAREAVKEIKRFCKW